MLPSSRADTNEMRLSSELTLYCPPRYAPPLVQVLGFGCFEPVGLGLSVVCWADTKVASFGVNHF